MSHNAFIDGRLQPIEISPSCRHDREAQATDNERTDYGSVVGSLQWLTTQSRPDLAFEVYQLQKQITDWRVGDLIRANKAVKDVVQNRFDVTFKNLGWDAELATYHDAGLFNCVGVELDEKEAEDVLVPNSAWCIPKKEPYWVPSRRVLLKALINVVDWKRSRRIVESSFAAETHAAVMGINSPR